jgi:hypothetical protein
MPIDISISPRNVYLGPRSYLAPGGSSAVPRSKEAASRKPDIASGVLYFLLEEPKLYSY